MSVAQEWGNVETHSDELADRAVDVLRVEAAAAGVNLNPGRSGGNVTAEWREYRRVLRDEQDTLGWRTAADVRDELGKTGRSDIPCAVTLLSSPIGVRTTAEDIPGDEDRVRDAVLSAATPKAGWYAALRLISELTGRRCDRPMPRHGAEQVGHGSRSAMVEVIRAAQEDAAELEHRLRQVQSARREAVKALRDSGLSLAEVGLLLGVTRQQVHALTR